MIYKPTGADLRELREKAGLSVDELAARAKPETESAPFGATYWAGYFRILEGPHPMELINETAYVKFKRKYLEAVGMDPIPPLNREENEVWLEAWRVAAIIDLDRAKEAVLAGCRHYNEWNWDADAALKEWRERR